MPSFNLLDRVISKTSNQKGIVTHVYPPTRGRQRYKVMWPSGECDELEGSLLPDCDITDPFERWKAGLWSSYSEFLERNTSFKIGNSNNNTISSLKASKTLFRPYQFKPLLKFLNSDNRRLLVADEVGLGKTIEAGHIMLELKARNELQNVLIVCPKSLQNKWKEELLDKFGLQFKIYQSGKELIEDLSSHSNNIRAIVNYEKIRLPRPSKDNKDKTRTSIAEYLSKNNTRFSLVLCDEAHKMRNLNYTHRGGAIIMDRADAAVFLTATPAMLNNDNLFHLLQLLDKQRFFQVDIFNNLISQNKPFIQALSMLNNGVSFEDIRCMLMDSEVSTKFTQDEKIVFSGLSKIDEVLEADPIYVEIINMLEGPDGYAERARLQQLLSSMSIMNNIFSRTRKREVTTDMSLAHREPHRISITLTDYEKEKFDSVIEEYIDDNSYEDYWGDTKMTQGGSLGLVQKKRQVASSVLAYLNDEKDLEQGIDRFKDKEDSKVEKLVEIINEVFKGGIKKIVIFAIFRKTLLYLQQRLKAKGFNSILIHGLIKERNELLYKFKTDPDIQILLSSEVGSEGLDMQFCNSLVNYDLPWNPMVVEQRIGRIDRFGQKSPVVNIYNFVVNNSIQEDIYDRLLERIGIFKGSIGDMEAILDAPINGVDGDTIQDAYSKLEKELFTSKLTEKERVKRIQEIEIAIEKEKMDIKELQKGLDNSLTNDAYFKDEINRIVKKKAFVTENELRNYLESIMSKAVPTASIIEIGEYVFRFKMPINDMRKLQNFLNDYRPSGQDMNKLFSDLKQDIQDIDYFDITFNQETAYENPTLMFINMYHPLILACHEYESRQNKENNTSFSYMLPTNDIISKDRDVFLGVYQITIRRKVMGIDKSNQILEPVVFDINSGSIETDPLIIDEIYGQSQVNGIDCNPKDRSYLSIMNEMQDEFAVKIDQFITEMIEEFKLQYRSEVSRTINQTKQRYENRISSYETEISRLEWELQYAWDEDLKKEINKKISINKGQITRNINERDSILDKINVAPEIFVDKKIISLNHITIKTN